jgi:hypothetical protein
VRKLLLAAVLFFMGTGIGFAAKTPSKEDATRFCDDLITNNTIVIMHHAQNGVTAENDVEGFKEYADDNGYPPRLIEAVIDLIKKIYAYYSDPDKNAKSAEAAFDHAQEVCVAVLTERKI